MSWKRNPLRFLGLLACCLVLTAADFYQVSHSTALDIDEHGTCSKITNSHASGKTLFVPTKTSTEWARFRTHLPAGVSLSSCVDLAAGLVGHWTFDEGAGTSAADASGLGNHGTLMGGAGWAAGVMGQAFSTSGGRHVRVPHHDSLSFDHANAVTFAGWVRNTTGGEITLIGKNNDGHNNGYFIYLAGADQGNVDFALVSSWDEGFYIYVSSDEGIVPANTWTHVAYTYDGSGDAAGVRLYVNGVPQSTYPWGTITGGSAKNSENLRIGSDWMHGAIDDVRIYNRVMSAGEVSALYALGE